MAITADCYPSRVVLSELDAVDLGREARLKSRPEGHIVEITIYQTTIMDCDFLRHSRAPRLF